MEREVTSRENVLKQVETMSINIALDHQKADQFTRRGTGETIAIQKEEIIVRRKVHLPEVRKEE